jgi:predicted metal-dependent phosphoesterase TrpH
MTHKQRPCLDVTPRVVPAGQSTTITIKAHYDHCRFDDGPYTAALFPIEGMPAQTNWRLPLELEAEPIENGLRIVVPFETEQEYALVLTGHRIQEMELRFYALETDLFSLRPFKGDVHIHSTRSDGRESPAYVAASSRRIGLDFMAVTDHWQYAPSQEAIAAFEDLPIDLRIYPGEEIHPPRLPIQGGGREIGSPVHMINFGGRVSVNTLMREQEATYTEEMRAIAQGMTDLPDELDAEPYAACVWAFDKIREAGGLGIFCHPYWFTRHRYDVPEALTDLIFERQPYDAFELIGGYHPFEITSNHLQVVRYYEEQAKGHRIPIVGASDAHGCETGELFGWYYTLVLSPSTDLDDLIAAIKGLKSVAVESLPGQAPRAYGPLRLVKYAQFLLREVLPEHDRLCRAEGDAMLDYLTGEPDAVARLAALQGRVNAYFARTWEQSGS